MVLDPVRYELEVQNANDIWQVRAFVLTEKLSDLYDCRLDLRHFALEAEPEALLGSSCSLTLLRGHEVTRRLHGVIHRLVHLGVAENQLLVRAKIVPALWALTQTQNSRIFQQMTAVSIVEQVIGDALKPYKRSVRSALHRKDYAVREYCVQYYESDYDFVRRLLHEEGIGFYFDHSGSVEELVLVDANAAYPLLESWTKEEARVSLCGAGAPSEEVIHHLHPERQLRPTSVVLREYDWKSPNLPVQHERRGLDGTQKDRLIYDAAPALCLEADEQDRRARLQICAERHGLTGSWNSGKGNVSGFAPGRRFELCGEATEGLEGRYLITAVTHAGKAADVLTAEVQSDGAYENSFSCIPEDVPYRPHHKVARPVLGTQTATVVGPAGEEIYTDEHGRIRVQFHWDREGQRNDKSSCWLRVMQSWAGAGFGSLFVPRIGMEVVVHFLEGNADRPLVAGCLYNGGNLTSMILPQEKTRTGFVTRSSPGGVGYNELIFEDTNGREEISLRAQKDLRAKILNDQSCAVGHDDTVTVDNDQKITVGHDRTLMVGNDNGVTIGANEKLQIGASRTKSVGTSESVTIGADRTTKVGASEALSVGSNQTINVGSNETVSVGANRKTRVSASDTLSVGGKQSTKVGGIKVSTVGGASLETIGGAKTLTAGGAYAINVGAGMNTLVLGPSTEQVGVSKNVKVRLKFKMECGASSLEMDKTGKISISGKDVTLKTASGHINIDEGGIITIKGTMVKINT